ncbi:tetratricopeptide repeat protein [Brumimicrobium mesophilum]|uniref:tetratricopeptide repeat protein n=1 Tax=Brumimicrobium mesophilum TaxID=392717 RepID=UPI000D140325|nr:hypothetical protein [Brumimicrobium mesophilum]
MKNIVLIFILLFSWCSYVSSADSTFQIGIEDIMQEDYKKAQNDFLKSTEKQPSFSSYYNLGVASGSLNDWNKAKWAFEASLKYKPLNGDAQYNAKFATQKLSRNITWTHPYPWLERIMLGFGTTTWIIAVSISSIFLGLLIFNSLSKGKSNLKKWCIRLIIPAILIFSVAFYGIYSTNKHYNVERYAILKNSDTKFHISPNGVQIRDEISSGNRFEIVKYFKDSVWVQVKTVEHNLLWVKSEGLYTY